MPSLVPWLLPVAATLLAGCADPAGGSDSDRAPDDGRSTDDLAPAEAATRVLERARAVHGLPASAERSALLTTLPDVASGRVEVLDEPTGVGAAFRLLGATDAPRADQDGFAVFPGGGPGGSDVIVRTTARGLEDYVSLSAPATLRYEIEPISARALRLVGGTLEIVDALGAPRVRVKRPYVVDAEGRRHAAQLDVEGCAVDRDPRAPWGRTLTELDREVCTLAVRYDAAIPHPVLVDPAWETAAFMNEERTHHTATLLANDTILVAGGFDETGAPVLQAEILCPELAVGCPTVVFTQTGSLSEGRGAHTETLIGTTALVTGGRSLRVGGVGRSSTETYDPSTGLFSDGPDMGSARWGHTATLLNTGDVLVVGGEDGTGASTAELYDGATFSPTADAMSGEHRRGHMAETLGNGQVLIAGGIGSLNAAVDSAELYDPATGLFADTDDMTSPRAWATATRLEDGAGRVLIVGGTNNSGFYYKTVDIYDPSIGGGTFVQQLLQTDKPRAFHAATKLIGEGKVLITGGFDGSVVHDDTEIFDSVTATFVGALSTTMAEPHNFHTATRLDSGKAVVIGGGVSGTAVAPGTGAVDVVAASVAEIFARTNGEPCEADGECLSNNCYREPGGICCNESCTDICSSCFADDQAAPAAGDGTCAIVSELYEINPQCEAGVQLVLQCTAGVIDVTDVKSCEEYACNGDECGTRCNGSDDCNTGFYCVAPDCVEKQDNGASCEDEVECASGNCIDGFCCNSVCDGICQACDVEGFVGTCSQVEGEPRADRGPCPGADPACQGVCGDNPLKCDFDQTQECGSSTCSGGQRTFGLCSLEVDGECAETTAECAPYACDEDGIGCVEVCATVDDCAEEAVCRIDGTCAIVESAACEDDDTLLQPDGTLVECGAFRCSGSACLTTCASIDDCVDGKVCDGTACIDPPPDPAPPDDCTVAAPRSGSPLPAAVLGALALLAAGRSARRRRSEARGR